MKVKKKSVEKIYESVVTRDSRPLRLTFLFSVTFVIVFSLYVLQSEVPRHKRFHKFAPKFDHLSVLIDYWSKAPQQCPPPNADFNDPITKKYLQNVSYTCPFQAPLTKLSGSGLLTLTKKTRGSMVRKPRCFYSLVWSVAGHDIHLMYHGYDRIPASGVQLNRYNDVVNVSCLFKKEIIYVNTHVFIPQLPESGDKSAPSVLIFFIESLSNLSFQRFMRLTNESLHNLGHVHVLRNFVKPMDNSFPNSMAVLTGKRIGWDDEVKLKNVHFDGKLPFVWEDFKKKGYVTGVLEDMAQIGVFNYGKKGFKEPPVDWYPRPYWLQMYPEPGSFHLAESMANSSYYCFHENGAKIDFFVNQVERFVKRQNAVDQPYFLFAFNSQSTHENFNNFKTVDDAVSKFLKKMSSRLDNTILVFGGDHGPRFNGMLKTSLGRLEERMPYVSIRIPNVLARKHPHLRRYLRANEESLTTWYDVHKMLKDVAEGTFQAVVSKNEAGPFNVARELVPRSRTCRDANIDQVFCVCNRTINLTNSTTEVWKAGMVLIDESFELMFAVMNDSAVAKENLEKVVSAQFLMPEVGKTWMVERLRLELQFEPSGAVISGVIVRNRTKGNGKAWEVESKKITLGKVVARESECVGNCTEKAAKTKKKLTDKMYDIG